MSKDYCSLDNDIHIVKIWKYVDTLYSLKMSSFNFNNFLLKSCASNRKELWSSTIDFSTRIFYKANVKLLRLTLFPIFTTILLSISLCTSLRIVYKSLRRFLIIAQELENIFKSEIVRGSKGSAIFQAKKCQCFTRL